MSFFISKKKQKVTSNDIKEGIIIIPDINIIDLDKKYGMKDITDSVFKKMVKKKSLNDGTPVLATKISKNNDIRLWNSENDSQSDDITVLEKEDDTIIIFDELPEVIRKQGRVGCSESVQPTTVPMGRDDRRIAPGVPSHPSEAMGSTDDSTSDTTTATETRDLQDINEIQIDIPNLKQTITNTESEKKLNRLKNKIENFLKEPPKVLFKKSNSTTITPRFDQEIQSTKDLITLAVIDKSGCGRPEGTRSEHSSRCASEKICLSGSIDECNRIYSEEKNKILVKKKLFKQLSTKEELDIKNVVTKLENIGISEQKSFNYNTLVKNESIVCSSYNCMNDINSQKILSIHDINKNGINIHCWWCRHSIPESIYPIGCPIKYHSGYRDAITGYKNAKEEYFDTEGIFCSFNCVISYNNDVSQNNIRYRETGGLIYLLYKKLFAIYPYQMNIKPALSWKVLKNYGGDMTIQEYRSTFQKLDNISQNFVSSFNQIMKSGSAIFVEEKSNVKLNQSEF